MSHHPNAAKGILAGMAASLAASLAMDLFQRACSSLGPQGGASEGPPQDDPSTVKLANRFSVAATGHRMPEPYKSHGGSAVHYGTGLAMGAAYGVGAEIRPIVTSGWGAGYGTALWVAIDEGLVPALRLGPPPRNAPLSEHAFSLASHLVFGVTLETGRRLVRRRL